jgi:hypothetical protein
MYELPGGWDLDRVRAMGVLEARLLPLDTYVVLDTRAGTRSDYIELAPSAILDCGGLRLVCNQDDGIWYMGSPAADGEILCWGPYGDDLGDAIRAL